MHDDVYFILLLLLLLLFIFFISVSNIARKVLGMNREDLNHGATKLLVVTKIFISGVHSAAVRMYTPNNIDCSIVLQIFML